VAAGVDRTKGSGLIAPAMLFAASLFAGETSASADQDIGGAEIVVNQVKGNLPSKGVVNVLQGDAVYRDEGVRTDPDSTTKLVLRDKTVLTVGPSSFVKLDRFVYPGEGLSGAIAVNVVKGALTFATGNAAKHSYAITTPTAALGVRGTIFRIEASAAKTRVVLLEGALNVCMRSGASCVDLVRPGQEAVVTVTQIAVTDPASTAAPGGRSVGTTAAPATTAPAAGMAASIAALREPPAADFSFIFETGRYEMDDKGIPETSAWAQKYSCGSRTRRADIVDSKAGYVYDSTRQDPGSDAWGRLPGPGTAEVYEYPGCQGGRVVADVVRLGKGHTEALEPNVTEQLIQLMFSAKKSSQ